MITANSTQLMSNKADNEAQSDATSQKLHFPCLHICTENRVSENVWSGQNFT